MKKDTSFKHIKIKPNKRKIEAPPASASKTKKVDAAPVKQPNVLSEIQRLRSQLDVLQLENKAFKKRKTKNFDLQ